MITLYDYFRSSSSYRVRIALYMKGLLFESRHIDLVAGEQRSDEYKAINPQGFVPTLIDEGGERIAQSMAIIEYLDDVYHKPPTVSGDAQQKALIRTLAQIVACEISPLNNPKVWKGYVGKVLGADEEASRAWYHHWIHEGLNAYEAILEGREIAYEFSASDFIPSLADICLIPQLYNARRFNVDLANYPNICRIEKLCIGLDYFQRAAPESHPEAPGGLDPIHGENSPIL
jgi:maleylacetoacetate isomerase